MLSTQRIERDLSIAGGFDANIIDTDFKTWSVIEACKKIGINCFDTRQALTADDYYISDNHLTVNGAIKLSKFILSNVEK